MGSHPARTDGRHRIGAQPSPWKRRLWDRRARAQARQLDEQWTGWAVLYGVGTRRFYALVSWPVPEPVVITARTADELEEAMREEEMAMAARHAADMTDRGRRRPV